MNPSMIMFVAFGGALGAVMRYLSTSFIIKLLGSNFPYGTLFVNILGSLVMGILMELFAVKINISPEIRVFIITGLLGGFTTFSAFSLDTIMLLEKNQLLAASSYILSSVILSIGALFIGISIVRSLI